MSTENAVRYGMVMFAAGRAYGDWHSGQLPWTTALLLWTLTSATCLLLFQVWLWLTTRRVHYGAVEGNANGLGVVIGPVGISFVCWRRCLTIMRREP